MKYIFWVLMVILTLGCGSEGATTFNDEPLPDGAPRVTEDGSSGGTGGEDQFAGGSGGDQGGFGGEGGSGAFEDSGAPVGGSGGQDEGSDGGTLDSGPPENDSGELGGFGGQASDGGPEGSVGGFGGSGASGGVGGLDSGPGGTGGLGGAGGSDSGPDPVCTPNETQCSGLDIETCSQDGTEWTTTQTCPYVCSNGSCTGVCVPGAVECVGQTGTRTCNVAGEWSATVPCPVQANQTPTCSGQGICGTTCQTGYDDCTAAPGCESDLSDPATCGSCSNTCNATGGTPTCSGGTCGIVCDGSHGDCNDDPGDGCEIDLGTTTDCLDCGDVCTAPANAVGVCTGSGCDFACTGLWDDCDGLPGNGCEFDVSDDPWNCGGCGISCHGGTCQDGACVEGITKVADATDVTSIAPGGFYGLGDIFWTETSGDIEKAPKTGGAATVMASGETSPQAAVTDGTNLFWSNVGSDIRSIPVGGGTASTFVAGHGPLELSHNGSVLVWTDMTTYVNCDCFDPTPTNIYSVGLGGGTPALLNPETNSRTFVSWPGVVADSENVYRLRWGTVDYGGLYWVSLTNTQIYGNWGTSITTSNGTENFHDPRNLMVTPDGQWLVFFTTLSGLTGPAIIKMTPEDQGGSNNPTLVNRIVSGVATDFAVDNDNVYVLFQPQGDIPYRVRRYSLTDPFDTEVMADNQFEPEHIEVDDTHVYWYTKGYKFSNVSPSVPDVAEKAILRMLK